MTTELLGHVRSVVHRLREEPDGGLVLALRTLAAGVHEPQILLSVEEGMEVDDPGVAHALYRCAQEGLTNAIRHGRASLVRIDLAHEREEIVLQVRDDGKGAAEIVPGAGLLGMRERLEGVGSSLAIDATPGRGVTLTARVPLTPPHGRVPPPNGSVWDPGDRP
jgi:signal transduction histidine kinase